MEFLLKNCGTFLPAAQEEEESQAETGKEQGEKPDQKEGEGTVSEEQGEEKQQPSSMQDKAEAVPPEAERQEEGEKTASQVSS